MDKRKIMMDDHTNEFLVIGAGPVGLAVAKALKVSDIPYHQVEADDDVGGNWYHGAYKSANVLSSKKATEYPDWPMPDSYPDFPSCEQMYSYYRMFADEFKLDENLTYNAKVVSVHPIKENRWQVGFSDGRITVYKGVLICNGHHWSRRYPSYDGVFGGESIHSKDYKTPDQLRNKRVLIIGTGNSAFDISSEAARVGKYSILSVRSGFWVFPKTFLGKPLSEFQNPILPEWFKMWMAKRMLRLTVGSHEKYGFPKPEIRIDQRHPTIDTDTLVNIRNGRIKVKGKVSKLFATGVEFEDGSREELDLIVYATGFHLDFPFLPPELSRIENNNLKVYGYGMYDDFKHIYHIGWFQPRGGVGSMITPYASLLAKLIQVQDNFSTPVGAVLKEMGEKLPETHLIGSPFLLKWVKKTSGKIAKIERLGKELDKRQGRHLNQVLNTQSPLMFEDKPVY